MSEQKTQTMIERLSRSFNHLDQRLDKFHAHLSNPETRKLRYRKPPNQLLEWIFTIITAIAVYSLIFPVIDRTVEFCLRWARNI